MDVRKTMPKPVRARAFRRTRRHRPPASGGFAGTGTGSRTSNGTGTGTVGPDSGPWVTRGVRCSSRPSIRPSLPKAAAYHRFNPIQDSLRRPHLVRRDRRETLMQMHGTVRRRSHSVGAIGEVYSPMRDLAARHLYPHRGCAYPIGRSGAGRGKARTSGLGVRLGDTGTAPRLPGSSCTGFGWEAAMRLEGERESANVEDERGSGSPVGMRMPGGVGGGLGIGGIAVVVVLALVF